VFIVYKEKKRWVGIFSTIVQPMKTKGAQSITFFPVLIKYKIDS
jgi:hypothetical protein